MHDIKNYYEAKAYDPHFSRAETKGNIIWRDITFLKLEEFLRYLSTNNKSQPKLMQHTRKQFTISKSQQIRQIAEC